MLFDTDVEFDSDTLVEVVVLVLCDTDCELDVLND